MPLEELLNGFSSANDINREPGKKLTQMPREVFKQLGIYN